MFWPFFEALRRHKHPPSHRAVGLALAIRAKSDEPVCWPSISCLCQDASVCRQTVLQAVNRFEQQGLIKVERSPGRPNRYRLTSSYSRRVPVYEVDGYRSTGQTGQKSGTSLQGGRDPSTGQTRTGKNGFSTPRQGPAISGQGEHHTSPSREASSDQRDNSVAQVEKSIGGGGGRLNTPTDQNFVDQVVSLYHEVLPNHPDVLGLSEKRRQAILARRDLLPELSKWRSYFEVVAQAPRLNGTASPREGYSTPFVADLSWLLDEDRMLEIMEGKHDGKPEARPPSQRLLNSRPPIADTYKNKTYEGTPDDELPASLR